MEHQNSFTNVDPQDNHESEIITSDSATDFAAENVPTTGPTSVPADALGSVNEEPINSAETLTDATIKGRQLILANLMDPYAAQITTVNHRLAALMDPYAAQITTVNHRLAALMDPYAAQITTVNHRLAALMDPYAAQITTVNRGLADLTSPYIEACRRGQLLERHEWFPHQTMLEFLFGGHIDDADFNALVLAYYRENWAEVRQMIEQNLSDCPVDDETKAAFHEALDSHESGRYLSVCRNLIPELERVVRIHLYGNKVGSFSVEKQMNICFGNLPVSVFPDRSLGWIGFKYLRSHLYDHIRDEADLERYVNHQIPNRHAAIHGLVTYDNVQNSLNSIFVADYVLQLITAWKAFERSAILSV